MFFQKSKRLSLNKITDRFKYKADSSSHRINVMDFYHRDDLRPSDCDKYRLKCNHLQQMKARVKRRGMKGARTKAWGVTNELRARQRCFVRDASPKTRGWQSKSRATATLTQREAEQETNYKHKSSVNLIIMIKNETHKSTNIKIQKWIFIQRL